MRRNVQLKGFGAAARTSACSWLPLKPGLFCADNKAMKMNLLTTPEPAAVDPPAGTCDAVMAYLAAGRKTQETLEPSVVLARVLQDPLGALGARLAAG